MSMIVQHPPLQEDRTWYSRGWSDYDSHYGLREGLVILFNNGETRRNRSEWTRGWRDALVCDLCDSPMAPKWMKDELGV